MDQRLSDRITEMLELAVEEGTCKLAQVPGYRVAGKTGTAQRAVDGGFDDQHHVPWFAGFLPLPDPQLVIVVAVENPTEDFWGSTVAAPAFAGIATAAVRLLEIPPQAGDSVWRTATVDGQAAPVAADGGAA
jgi:cell division protein FtsI/penicillin-binding protein 2